MLKWKKLRSIIDYKYSFFTTIFVNLYFEERPYQIKTIEGRYTSVKCLGGYGGLCNPKVGRSGLPGPLSR